MSYIQQSPEEWPKEPADPFLDSQSPEERDELYSSLFRAFLPEEYDEIGFEGLVRIATEEQGSEAHKQLIAAATEFKRVLQERVQAEINQRKEVA